MRLLKGFVLAIGGLFIMITLVSLLMPSKVMTVRSVQIHGTPRQVFDQVADLQKWRHWHPVFMQDGNARFSTPSNDVNSQVEWNFNGRENKLLVTGIAPMELRASLMRAGENDVLNVISVMALKDSNNVQVEWRALTKLKWYPWEKFAGIFVDRITGPGYETALNNLKLFIEK